uniref:Protein Wnt n=1 Tax=Cacopsylla melanoneura TaxID=428564 RepID=A0A8D8QIN9_9HEMI
MKTCFDSRIAGIIFLVLILVQAISGSQFMMDPKIICKKTRRLKARLLEICKNEPTVLLEISKGIQLGTKECQYQFQNRRWNCTLHKKSMKKVLQRDSRETGFVNAVISAGVSYNLAKACSRGTIPSCGCGKISSENKVQPDDSKGPWQWGGCSDNAQHALKKAKTFMEVDSLEMGDLKSLTMRHNFQVGRTAIWNSMETVCKCHGTSGSCMMRTCWRSLVPFRKVGDLLKKRFQASIKVVPSNNGHSFIPYATNVRPPDKLDLVYSEKSPSFCVENKTTGSLGTFGRQCWMNESATTESLCSNLCCGRGNAVTLRVENVLCNCSAKRFDVQCQNCTQKTLVYHCL